MGESQKDLMRACAREEIDVHLPFEELPQSDQDFVINGEKKTGDYEEDDESDRWYGVRGFFKWLESKTYKMHVRVLLSRYRAYTTCPSCNGGRFQPDALNYRIVTAPPSPNEWEMAGGGPDAARARPTADLSRARSSRASSSFRLTIPPRPCCGARW